MYGHEDAKFDPTHCKETPPYVPLSEYDVMWGEFPGSKAVPRCMNHIKMGYPNWKNELAALASEGRSKENFVRFWKEHGRDSRYSQKRVKAAWDQFLKEEHTGSWAEQVYNSTAIAQLAKD